MPDGKKPPQGSDLDKRRRLRFRTWVEWDNEKLCKAVVPALRLHIRKIPQAKLESVRVAEEDVLQAAALNLMTHPKFVRRLLSFEEACRLYAKFIRFLCERIAKKQNTRNRAAGDAAQPPEVERQEDE